MEKILQTLAAAMEAEKNNTAHLVIAKELFKQLSARLALHAGAVAAKPVTPEPAATAK